MSGTGEVSTDEPTEAVNPVTTLTGDFYQAYKKGALEFLYFVSRMGTDGLASSKLMPNDAGQVRYGLNILAHQGPQLFEFLDKLTDEAEPSFWSECTAQYIWSVFTGIFLIAQHSGMTESAKLYLQESQTKLARTKKAGLDADRQKKQKAALRILLAGNPVHQPNKIAESIFRTDTEFAKLKDACAEQRVPTPSESTAKRLLREMRDQADSLNVQTVSLNVQT